MDWSSKNSGGAHVGTEGELHIMTKDHIILDVRCCLTTSWLLLLVTNILVGIISPLPVFLANEFSIANNGI